MHKNGEWKSSFWIKDVRDCRAMLYHLSYQTLLHRRVNSLVFISNYLSKILVAKIKQLGVPNLTNHSVLLDYFQNPLMGRGLLLPLKIGVSKKKINKIGLARNWTWTFQLKVNVMTTIPRKFVTNDCFRFLNIQFLMIFI